MDKYRRIKEVIDSVSKAQESVEINRNQCKRLEEVYNAIWQSLQHFIENNVEEYNTALLKAFDPLLQVMEVGQHLVLEVAGPRWFQSLIKYADNKEAFQEVHGDLHLWAQHLLGINLGEEFNPSELITDACWDRQEMANKLIDMQYEQKQGEHVPISGAGQEQVKISSSSLAIAIYKLLKHFDNSPLLNSEGEIVEPQENYIIGKKLKASLEESELVHVTLSYHQVSPPPTLAMYVPVHDMDPDLRIPSSQVEILDFLGRGGSSVVRRARWAETEVAAKIFNSKDVRELRKEVATHQKLNHPNVVRVFGFSEGNRDCMILMELMEFNLHGLIDKRRALVRPNEQPFPPQQAIRLMRDIAAGMVYVHDHHDLMHGDLKTENVLGICKGEGNYQLKVADFGLTQRKITTSSGTNFFRAPEVLEGKGAYTFKSEVYSFAMIAYEILTGEEPFKGEDIPKTRTLVIKGKRPPIPKYVDTAFQRLLQKYWHQDQDSRPTFREICAELGKFQTEIGPQPKRPTSYRRFKSKFFK